MPCDTLYCDDSTEHNKQKATQKEKNQIKRVEKSQAQVVECIE